MSDPADLTSLDNALQWLGLAQDDGTTERLITAASTVIQKAIGYELKSASYTRSFNGPGGAVLVLPDRPVTAVTAVSVDGQAVPPQALPSSGFCFDTTAIYLSGCYRFTRGMQNVSASYTAGYAVVPFDLEQATLDLIKSIRESFPGFKEFAAGDTKVVFDDAVVSIGGSAIPLPPAIASTIMPYRRVSPAM